MNKKQEKFIATVWDYYKELGRHTLPWRQTHNPYAILVSEIMLQQTQVDRVVPKYEAFMKKYKTLELLAKAPLGSVLTLWQGLGYNRRAKMLHLCAQTIVKEHNGVFPRNEESLLALPGIGPYTASAVLAFAYNIPVTLIETNVRNVFIHHFFADKNDVSDTELLPLIAVTQDMTRPRDWYYALMDYGSYLKKTYGNANKKSAHYAKQSTFKGSDRQIRGVIIRMLTKQSYSQVQIRKELSAFEDIRVDAQLYALLQEELVIKKGAQYKLPS